MQVFYGHDFQCVRDYYWTRQYVSAAIPEFPMHNHDFYEFFYIHAGEALHCINGQSIRLQPGHLHLIFPDDTHQLLQHPDSREALEIYNCNIKPEEFIRQFWRLVDTGGCTPDDLCRATELNGHARRSTFHEKICAVLSMQLNPRCPVFVMKASFRSLLGEVLSIFLQKTQFDDARGPEWLENTVWNMQQEQNFLGGVSRMVELAGRTQEHLDRTLRKYYGMSPREFVLELKLNYVASLITLHGVPITRAIARAGFSNFSYFRRCFSQRFCMSPREYRQCYEKQIVSLHRK